MFYNRFVGYLFIKDLFTTNRPFWVVCLYRFVFIKNRPFWIDSLYKTYLFKLYVCTILLPPCYFLFTGPLASVVLDHSRVLLNNSLRNTLTNTVILCVTVSIWHLCTWRINKYRYSMCHRINLTPMNIKIDAVTHKMTIVVNLLCM